MKQFPYEPSIIAIRDAVQTISTAVRDSMAVLAGRSAEVRSASLVELSQRIENEQLDPFPLSTDAVVELQLYAFCAKRFASIQTSLDEVARVVLDYATDQKAAEARPDIVLVPRRQTADATASAAPHRANGTTNGTSNGNGIQTHVKRAARPQARTRIPTEDAVRGVLEWAQRNFTRRKSIPYSAEEVANTVGLPLNTVKSTMRKLINDEAIIKEGDRNTTQYRLGSKAAIADVLNSL